jgi:hypothetical protein
MSSAAKVAAVEFAKAKAMRPKIVGEALNTIGKDPEVSKALFDVLETQNILDSDSAITLVPKNNAMLASLLASGEQQAPAK